MDEEMKPSWVDNVMVPVPEPDVAGDLIIAMTVRFLESGLDDPDEADKICARAAAFYRTVLESMTHADSQS